MSQRLRALHKWCALGLVVLLVLQGATGLILAHREALERLAYLDSPATAARSPGTPASLDELVANIQVALPGRLERIVWPKTPGVLKARVYDDEDRMYVAYLDPASGRVLSAGTLWVHPVEVAERVHVSLLMDDVGTVVLFIEALGLCFLTISGVWLWWPRGRRFLSALTVHWQSGTPRVIRDLHVVPGVLVALLVFTCALGATLLVGEPLVKPIVSAFSQVGEESPLEVSPTDRTQPVMSWQQSLERLQERFPDGRLRQVRPAGADGRLVAVLFVAQDELNPRTHHYGGVDRYTGEMTIYMDATTRPGGERFIDWFLPVHSGEIYGAARGTVLSIVGGGLLALSVTGVLMWWRQRRSRRRSARSRQVSAATTAAQLTAVSVLMLCASWAPRESQADTTEPKFGGEVRVAINSDILSTNPGVLRDGNTDTVLYHIGESLVAYRDDLTVGLLLAEALEVSEDGTLYTFRLRPDVVFHNGARLTAHEVKWTWDRLLDRRTGFRCLEFYDGSGASSLQLLAVEIVDERTVRFRLNAPSTLFLHRMANVQCQTPILHPDSVSAQGEWREPVGTGPYRLAEWRRGRYVTLARFEQYRPRAEPRDGLTGEKIAYLDRITFVVVPDRVQAKTSVYAGNIDLAFAVPLGSYAELRRREAKRADIRLYRTDTLDWTVLLLQTNDPLLGDVRMRRALAHAISGELVTEASTFGLAQYNPSAVQALSEYHNEIHDRWWQYDRDRARELARAAGYRGEPLVIQTNRRFPYMFDNAVAIQALLVDAGFDARIEVLDWASQLSNFFAGRFQLSSFGYSSRSHPAILYGNFIGEKSARASVQWDDEAARQSIERIERMADTSRMQTELDELHRMMREQVPIIGLYNDHVLDVSKASLQNYRPWVFGRPRLWGVWKRGGD